MHVLNETFHPIKTGVPSPTQKGNPGFELSMERSSVPLTFLHTRPITGPVLFESSLSKTGVTCVAKPTCLPCARLDGRATDPPCARPPLDRVVGAPPTTPRAIPAVVGSARPTAAVVVGRALVVANPILVTTRPDVALADRPTGTLVRDGPRVATTTRPGQGTLVATRLKPNGQALVLAHLGVVAAPACALPASAAGR